jgi:hypothetical protein
MNNNDNNLLSLHFDVRGALLDAARDCELEVFQQSFGNTADQLEEEYGPYSDQSVFVAVSDAQGDVLGACRIITPGAQGLKTLNDLARAPWSVDGARSARAAGLDASNFWDIGTLGVRREARGSKAAISLALYHAIIVGTTVNEVAGITAILDEPARRVLSMADFLLPTLPGTRTGEYLGSEASTPVYGHRASVLDAQRRLNPEAYRLMTQGVGLDGISIPSHDAFRLRPRLVPAAPAAASLALVSAA